MALDSIVFSNEIVDKANRFFSINLHQYPILDEDGNVIPSSGDYPFDFAQSYETYSLTGEVKSALHGDQQPSIIEDFLRVYNTSIYDFATALAEYWFTVLIIPGEPTHGGISVVSVENDATSFIDSFYDAITASLTQEWKMPIYNHFINNIEEIALPDVTWYITELMPNGSTSVFTEKVF